MSNPCGIFVQGQGLSEDEINVLITHAVKAQYTTLSIMDSYAVASRLQDALPNAVIVTRDSTFEPAPDYSMTAFADYLRKFPDKRIVHMIDVEQGFNSAFVSLWVRMMGVASSLGYKLCVGNMSSGSVKCGQGDDPNEWATIGEPLLRAFQVYPQHYLGFHDYSMPYPWAVSNGAWGVPNQPPSQLDWTKPQWHIGRNVQGIQNACKSLNLKPPACIVTECLIDTMGDIVEHFGLKADGYKTLAAKWQEWYPGKDKGDVLADMHQWAWEKAYKPCGFVIGTHTYTYADASGDVQRWKNYRVDDEPRYLARMEVYRDSAQLPPPAPPPPDVLDTAALLALVEDMQATLNQIREALK